jgi:hypothetical protein
MTDVDRRARAQAWSARAILHRTRLQVREHDLR